MNKTYIIAEIGINHNGDLDIAKKLIDVAKFLVVMPLNFKNEIQTFAYQTIKRV
jgi:sialic acid synthase SpsE